MYNNKTKINRFFLASELRGAYHLEQLQEMGLVLSPSEDFTQDEIENLWETSDGYELLNVYDEDCEDVYKKVFGM
ncbi:hypothetical protein GMA43_13790 [Turicibacter sanguinis]|uniref:hypothetical protein n=1 Tax=Turicibacter TaxID=191303 RepID=UPI000FF89245|nr:MULTISPECIES: hypothetical protein [unclassified Turicibacter]MTH08341.1 hypothetical protein [Turicibacter sanguinis]RXD25810.1 hypothetical protein EJB02_19220 [Acinetobacter baumannii]MCU7192785.1 hypothetical protein [Turicibacter sp. T129]MCU7208203.1 hypothetical protein [Turicibacter sp. GALT-G1]MTH11138.1 hypothetical protein [Turicibacter sanguinis]